MPGRRVETSPNERSIALAILVIGTLGSLSSLLGGVWVMRGGLLLAIGMAFAAVYVSWRQLRRERIEHQSEIRREVASRIDQAERHHAETLSLIERYDGRILNLKEVTSNLRRQLAAANSELATMRGNAVWLRSEIAERQARIDALTIRVTELETAAHENVVDLPRHGVATALSPSVDDVWGDDEHPTMVDLAKIDLDIAVEERRQA